ncbi:hypothetical protein COB52_05170 [Candidatus Kaiserbacteria bacterium]|nr:MAG: hypothetical protein COB52_05170 [Candidatus Kaiserbacteria bacterium]
MVFDHDKFELEWIIKSTSSRKLYWDMFIIILAIYNSFSIPFVIAFEPPGLVSSTLFDFLNTVIDLIFMCDIAVMFRTTYMNKFGDEVVQPRMIACNYLTSKFWLDFLSSVPMDLFGSGEATKFLTMFGMLKIVRVTRIGKII